MSYHRVHPGQEGSDAEPPAAAAAGSPNINPNPFPKLLP